MVGDHTSHLRWFAVTVFDGPNIKCLLTPDFPYWPLPAAPCWDGNVVSHGAKCYSKRALRPKMLHTGHVTLSPLFGATVSIDASGVRPARVASPCGIGINFQCKGQGSIYAAWTCRTAARL